MKILVALSGGADSVFLTYVLSCLKNFLDFQLLAVHVNHRLRSYQSDEDEAFVKNFCNSLGLPLIIERLDGTSSSENKSRIERYRILKKVYYKYGASCCMIAHNADDNIETMLFNLCRGTGLNGLSGIPKFRLDSDGFCIRRPALSLYRVDINRLLGDLPFIEDLSNQDCKFKRNFIRHKVIPILKGVNTRAKEHLTNFSKIVRAQLSTEGVFLKKVRDCMEERLDGVIVIDLDKFMVYNDQLRRYVLINILRRWAGYNQIHRIVSKLMRVTREPNSVFTFNLRKGRFVKKEGRLLLIGRLR